MISIWIDLIQWASSNIIHTEARSNNNNNRERDKNNRPGFISINLGRNAIHKRTRARVYSLSRENFTLLPAFFSLFSIPWGLVGNTHIQKHITYVYTVCWSNLSSISVCIQLSSYPFPNTFALFTFSAFSIAIVFPHAVYWNGFGEMKKAERCPTIVEMPCIQRQTIGVGFFCALCISPFRLGFYCTLWMPVCVCVLRWKRINRKIRYQIQIHARGKA